MKWSKTRKPDIKRTKKKQTTKAAKSQSLEKSILDNTDVVS